MSILPLYVLIACVTVVASSSIVLINRQVNTYIDVSSNVAFVNRKVLVENLANEKLYKYTLIIDRLWFNNLSFIEAVDGEGNYLKVVRDYTPDSQLVRYDIFFEDVLYPSTQQILTISTVFINILQNYPKSIKQNERHFVLFKFNVYFYSPYFTDLQTTVLYTGVNKVSYVDGAEFTMSNDSDTKYGLQYGPFHYKQPDTELISSVHFENVSPFLTVEKLNRQIQISHWGFLTVRDRISLSHVGPKLEGPYERPLRGATTTDSTRIEHFISTLPRHAFDISLKDDIGLISSFSVDYSDEDKVDVKIKPRFVLYGGWKADYEISYTLPLQYYYLNHQNDTFSLSFPLTDKIFQTMVVYEADIRLILPEGAIFQDIDPYVDLENNTNSKYCYFFDTICREVISFKKYKLVNNHCNINVRLTYSFSQYLLLIKPISFGAFIYVALLLVLAFSRLSTKATNERNENNSEIRGPLPITRKSKSEQTISKTADTNLNNRPKRFPKKK